MLNEEVLVGKKRRRLWTLIGTIGIAGLGLVSLVNRDKDSVKLPSEIKNVRLGGVTGGIQVEVKSEEEKVLEAYDKRFDGFDRGYLRKSNVNSDTANLYAKDFTAMEIVTLANKEITYDIANEYPIHHASQIRDFVGHDISADLANQYIESRFSKFSTNFYTGEPRRSEGRETFSTHSIIWLHKRGVSPQEVGKYTEAFSVNDVLTLIEDEVSAEEANPYGELNDRYGAFISGFDIAKYKSEGISFDEVAEQAKKNWFERSVDQ